MTHPIPGADSERPLPPLPEPDGDWAGDDWFTADSMAAYVRADRAAAKVGANVAADDPDEESSEDCWRRLALQFDGHRMQALGHLKMMVKDAAKHADATSAFLSAGPLSGEAVLAERIARIAAGAPAETPKPVLPFHYYGLSAEELQQLLSGCLKPEEIASDDDEKQHGRVGELVRWFVRFTQGHANPKWATRHACELAYFIATNGINRTIDLDAITKAAFKEGVNITPEERGTLERIGFAQPSPAPIAGDVEKDALLRIDKKLVDAINGSDLGAPKAECMALVQSARNDLVRIWLPMQSAAMLANSSSGEAG